VEAWSRQSDGRYKRVARFPDARIGSAGTGAASESVARTPVGQFRLSQPFGIKPGTCPAGYGSIERLSNYPGAYDYAVFIGYNAPAPYGTGAVRGKGSAFFLHVKNSRATAGCVAVSAGQMVWLLRWLRAAQNPTISIGVGSRAYAPIPNRYV
jgi:L,D-peptidoglycan transpeptidase YkuD (ErfK/YbiS/YcfS/YnhG family)